VKLLEKTSELEKIQIENDANRQLEKRQIFMSSINLKPFVFLTVKLKDFSG